MIYKLLAVTVILSLFGCSSESGLTSTPGTGAPDVAQFDVALDASANPDAGHSDDVGPDLCGPAPEGSFCDGQRIVECVDGTPVELSTCPGGCSDDGPDPTVCLCDADDVCGDGLSERCIEGACRPTPCNSAGDRYCDGNRSVSCSGDEGNLECPGGCENGRCQCDGHEACPDGYGCVDEGASAQTCRPTSCDPGSQWCEARVRVSCNEGGLSVTELELCDGACLDDGNELVRCGCAAPEHCGGDEYCAAEGTCQPRECEPSSTGCDDLDNAVVRCDDVGAISSVEACGDLTCTDGACRCDEDAQCDEGQFCDHLGACRDWLCTPSERVCTGVNVAQCNEQGSAPAYVRSCPADTACSGGECLCDETGQCADGESCDDGACFCESDVFCDERCCGQGQACVSHEICEQGVCNTLQRCLPECQNGTRCGSGGELCCGGDTPVCDPRSVCVPECGADRALCGANLDFCCEAGDLCLFDSCRSPGVTCSTFLDCDFGEYCEPTLGRCLPDEFPPEVQCREEGDFLELDVAVKWQWTELDIISIPVVGDVTGDGQPNVVVNTTRVDGGSWPNGKIVILDAVSGAELRRIEHVPNSNSWGSQGRSNIALADVTGDGVMEIIYASRTVSGRSYIVAANGLGQTLWRAHDAAGTPITVTVENGAITVANFDSDPSRAQIVVGAMLIDSDGLVVWNQGGNGPIYGSNSSYTGGVAVVADLTGDGKHEIVTGRHAWTVDWQPGAAPNDPPNVTVDVLWTHSGGDGYPAVADMDGDGQPEVVLVSARSVRVLNGQTGQLWCGVDPTDQACINDPGLRTQPAFLWGPTSNNRGGPPTVADFDGDGRPEIGVAGGHAYVVFDINRPGFGGDNVPEVVDPDLLQQFGQPEPALGQIYIRWFNPTRDQSSNATGSSVFDFQGNGSASVIYADECFMRVYSGIDGEVELEIPNSSGTILEYPLVVDVDANGRSEILVVANFIDHCSGFVPNYQPRRGLYVYEDPNDRWVRTRSIWNQHAYSIDNIMDDGSVPALQSPSWATHNTFRSNRQGEIPLNSPNPSILSLSASHVFCPPEITLSFVVGNPGTRGIPPGMPISIYRTDTPQIELLTTVHTAAPLFPGGVIPFQVQLPIDSSGDDLSLRVVANDDGLGNSPQADCNEDSATADLVDVPCAY